MKIGTGSLRLAAFLPLALLAACGGAGRESNTAEAVVVTGNDSEIVMPQPRAPENAADNAADASRSAANLAPDGLSLVLDSGARRVPFGLGRAETVRIASAALGSPVEQGDNEECGAGPLGFASFPGGLGLYFQGGKFAGWDLDGRDGGRFTTAAGIGIGSTRKQLEAAGPVTVADSSLGIEFRAGALSGLLSARDPGGEVTNLWAGATCLAR
jgi:hypothetical protein